MVYRHLYIIVGLTAMICSCSNESNREPDSGNGNAVCFEIGSVMSRSVTNPDNSTEFVAGDRIGIFGEKGAVGSNVEYIVGSDGSLQAAAGTGVVYNPAGGDNADFHAYYPYADGQGNDNVVFTVADDQSTPELFNASDFMTSQTLGVATNSKDPVKLIFKHRLAIVQLEIITAQTASVKGASLCKLQRTMQWDLASNTVSPTGSSDSDISMWNRGTASNTSTYWAAIPAQTVATGTRLLTINFGDDSYGFTATSPITLKEGTIKKFRISIGDLGDIVVLSPELEVSPWEEDPDVVEGSGELIEPDPLMPLQDFSDFSATLISKTKEEITVPGWYLFHLYDNDALEIAADGDRDKVMHIKRVLQDGKSGLEWHNGAYYFAAANPGKRVYTLTFTARSSFAENMKSNQLRIGAYMKDADGKDNFVAIKKGDDLVTTVYYQVPSEEYATYTLEFDMSKVSTVHNGNPQTEWAAPDADMLKLVTLYITSNAAGIDFWIDDISWK